MKKVNRITEGAIFLALYTVLLLIFLYIPFINIIGTLFLALPFMMFSSRNETKLSGIFLLASFILSFIFGNFIGLATTFAYGTTGIVTGELIKRGTGRVSIFIASTITFLINIVIQYAVAVALFQYDFIKDTFKVFKQSMDQSFKMMESLGQSQEQIQQLQDQFRMAIELLETLTPSLLLISTMMIVFLLQLVSFPIMKRFGIEITPWPSFKDWRLPKSILWYYLIAMILTIVLKPEDGTYLYWALANLAFILQLFILLQGLSLIFYYAYIKNWPKAVPIIITGLSFLLPLLLYIIRILGIIDLGFDIRKHLNKK